MDDMGFNWQDLPPAFMGTTSSFGPQPTNPTNDISSLSFSGMNLHMGATTDRHASSTSADVLAAASLLQNGHSRPHNSIDNPLFAAQDLSLSLAAHSDHQTLTTSYDQTRSRPLPARQDPQFGDTFFAELMFGAAAGDGRPHPKGPPKDADIHWGSDVAFGSGQGYIAPPGQVSVEAIEQKLISVVEAVEAKGGTAPSTCPNSPVLVRHIESFRRNGQNSLNGQSHEEEDEDSRPRKRRKSKMKEEEDEEDEEGIAAKASRKRKPKSIGGPSTTQSPPPSKRRKSGATAAKPPRENLTEDQKRENHIKSEQKRRTLIKEGFDDLNELVPDLRGGGHSKSVVLVMAADWLEDLIGGNKVLRARLQELEGNL